MSTSRRVSIALIILAVILFAAGAALLFLDSTQTETTLPLIGKHSESLGQLTPDSAAAQTFTAAEDGLVSVEVMVTTYAKKVTEGTLSLHLLDEGGNEVAAADFAAADLKNTAFVTFRLDKPQKSAGKQYTLRASSDITDQRGVSLRIGPAEGVGTLTLADGTVDPDNVMNIRLTYQRTTPGVMACMTCALVGLCCFTAAFLPSVPGKEKRHA